MKIFFSFLVLLLCSVNLILGQDLPAIVPLSPNAASIAKYGEIPVGYFTGVPNIGIPIYTVQSSELSLPLSLNYHAGGNLVESVASWVGLGWSLGTIPSISRSVRGIPDENNGYFSMFNGKTVKQLWDEQYSSVATFDNFRVALFDGTADSEPDIFNYSLPEESGKFFYNQESESFITFPKSNVKITRNGDSFTLITQGGIEYTFDVIETSKSSGATEGNHINTSWYASTMTSASKKDIIRFTYQTESQVRKTKNVVTKYHYLGGLSNGFPSDNGSILTTNTNKTMVIDSIVFDNGYVKFNRNLEAYRTDLYGSYSLKNISIYNNSNKLINKHEFTYHFKQGTGNSGTGTACYGADNYSRNWMLLDKVEKVSTTDPNNKLSHAFTYNEAYFPACRYSAAQDYWGYYNGNDFNSDLTPPYFLPNSDTQIAGANRGIDPSKSKYGILTKIIYPTGGYTEFDFENNEAYANDLPSQYVSENQMMAGDEYFYPGETLNETNFFQKTFSIDNPSDPVLNNDNINGGAIVSFDFFNPGCDLSSGQANECARFTVSGPSLTTTDITIYGSSFYLPNGTYTMTASFNQPYPNTNYQDFIFITEWQKIAPNQTVNTYTGGLRIKETRSYASSYLSPITKKYKYTSAYNSTESSGDIFGTPNFSHTNSITYHNSTPPQNGVNSSALLRVRSISNIQQVTQSGSPVGYSKVFEETNNVNETGYTEYHFSNMREPSYNIFPYPPSESLVLERGLLIRRNGYKKSNSGFDLVNDSEIQYTSSAFDMAAEYPKSSLAIKWGNLFISDIDPSSYIAQRMIDYNVIGGWRSISSETNTSFNDNDSIATKTLNYYDNPTHLLKTRTVSIDSQGKRMISTIKYPQDVSSSIAITGLINQNRLDKVIETKSYIDLDNDLVANSNELLSAQQNDYRVWYTDVITPEFIKTSKGINTLKSRIVFQSYYENGKVKEVSKADGIPVTYLWGYNSQYPVAKIENAAYNDVEGLFGSGFSLGTGGLSFAQENLLRSNLPQAMVTTYTYEPLIGVTSITDPRGDIITYHYDSFNRLEFVKDAEGNILSENKYNYKQITN